MNAAITLIRMYQTVNRAAIATGLLPAASGCRQWPTCSEYAVDAIRTKGTLRGSLTALRRISRCHPWARTVTHVY